MKKALSIVILMAVMTMTAYCVTIVFVHSESVQISLLFVEPFDLRLGVVIMSSFITGLFSGVFLMFLKHIFYRIKLKKEELKID